MSSHDNNRVIDRGYTTRPRDQRQRRRRHRLDSGTDGVTRKTEALAEEGEPEDFTTKMEASAEDDESVENSGGGSATMGR